MDEKPSVMEGGSESPQEGGGVHDADFAAGCALCPECGSEGDLVGYRQVRWCCDDYFCPSPEDLSAFQMRPRMAQDADPEVRT